MELSNGALIHFPTTRDGPADLALVLTRPQLLQVVGAGSLDGVETTGDEGVLTRILALTDAPDIDFAVVVP